MGLADGTITDLQFLDDAWLPENRALLTVELFQLLVNQKDWSDVRARQVLRLLLELAAERRPPSQLTVSWLLDARSGGRRYFAWLEARERFAKAKGRGRVERHHAGLLRFGISQRLVASNESASPLRSLYRWDELPGLAGQFSTGYRTDPFYENLFGEDGRLSWQHGSAARESSERAALGERGRSLPSRLSISRAEALARLRRPGARRAELLTFLSVTNAWSTVTATQMAAFTGVDSLASAKHPLIAAAFAADVVSLALPYDTSVTSLLSNEVIYRAGFAEAFDIIRADLTMVERTAVLAGEAWRRGPWYDRHNVLATELALRIAEYVRGVAAVIGPAYSTVPRLLLGTARPWTPHSDDKQRRNAGDFTVIMDDGLRVVVELTATVNDEFDDKIRTWARFLWAHPLESTGISVLIVDARAGRSADAGEVAERVRAVVTRLYESSHIHMQVLRRLRVASWSDWFPDEGVVAGTFLSLTAVDLECDDASDGRRPIRDLRFDPAGWDPTEILGCAGVMLQTPVWLRAGLTTADAGNLMLDALGLTGVPIAAPRRPERARGHKPGAAKGAVGATRLPPRLRWPSEDPRLQPAVPIPAKLPVVRRRARPPIAS